MPTPQEIAAIDAHFPILQTLPNDRRRRLFDAAQIVKVPAGQILMQQRQTCRAIPLILKGALRIFKLSESGREMTLFRTGAGDTCLVSIACRLRGEAFPAQAQVEQDAVLCLFPIEAYDRELDSWMPWKNYLVSTLYDHLTDTMSTLEAVAFDRTDRRLIGWLIQQAKVHGETIAMTHEAIAVELGTAREVVSRLLGDLRQRGYLQLGRGKVKILSLAALQALLQDG